MKRLFLVCDDVDFADWIEEELSEIGRFVKSINSFDFFTPQWNAAGGADFIIVPESAFPADDVFMKIYTKVMEENKESVFLLIHHRKVDQLIELLLETGNICISYEALETGLLEKLIQEHQLDIYEENPSVPIEQSMSVEANICNDDENEHNSTKEITSEIQPINLEQKVEERNNHNLNVDIDQPKIESVQNARNTKRSVSEQREKLARIKERIIIEEKIVTVHVPVHYNSKLISVVSLYPRAGATFVVSNFARMLGEHKVPVAVLEPVSDRVGSTYYELMHGEVNAPKGWQAWAEQIQRFGMIKNNSVWQSHGVTWIPSSIEPIKGWNEENNMKLLLEANRSPVTICDISSNFKDEHCHKIMAMSDEIWIVIDGDPIALSHHFRDIDDLKQNFDGKSIKVIGNRWNKYINTSEWKEAVLLPILTNVPDLGVTAVKQLWAGKMSWDDTKSKNELSKSFKPLVRSSVAKEMHHIFKNRYGIAATFKKMIKDFKTLEDEIGSK